jgi:ABC-type antimicrobial peptide transport system permease subunit
LTVLGIFIGVASIITMVTLGEGSTLAVKAQISSLGSNLLTLRPGAGFGQRGSSAGVPSFTERDAETLGEQIASIAAIAPVIKVPFNFNTQINVIAFAFSAIVSVLFGYTPARRAAKLNPIDALRHE